MENNNTQKPINQTATKSEATKPAPVQKPTASNPVNKMPTTQHNTVQKQVDNNKDWEKAKKLFNGENPNGSSKNIAYEPLSNVNQFKNDAKQVLGGHSNDLTNHKDIVRNGKRIGYVGFSEFKGEKGDNFNNALGIGDFMINERGKGYGTEVIKDIVNKNKNKYDLIYCFVDADNEGAIKLYKKLGKVYDEEGPNANGQYYVTFYDKNNLD